MNDLERILQLESARKLKEREEIRPPFHDPYSDMTTEEKSKMIMALVAAREKDAKRIDELLSKTEELLSLREMLLAAESNIVTISKR